MIWHCALPRKKSLLLFLSLYLGVFVEEFAFFQNLLSPRVYTDTFRKWNCNFLEKRKKITENFWARPLGWIVTPLHPICSWTYNLWISTALLFDLICPFGDWEMISNATALQVYPASLNCIWLVLWHYKRLAGAATYLLFSTEPTTVLTHQLDQLAFSVTLLSHCSSAYWNTEAACYSQTPGETLWDDE